jgi:hypothetical protein
MSSAIAAVPTFVIQLSFDRHHVVNSTKSLKLPHYLLFPRTLGDSKFLWNAGKNQNCQVGEMLGETRSTGGCWTCKLRKKKCDEAKPACAICCSLNLECSGYGSKPDWMDAGAKEKEMVAKMGHTVKEASSQKKRIAMRKRQGQLPSPEEEITSFEPLLTDSFSSTGIIPRRFSLEPTESARDVPLLIDGTPPGLTPKDAAAYVAQNESVLLMHYLDNVFPCQFRFYQPSLEDGGRGWLLSLLMQTKPLYHAACSLAAYHRQMMYCLTGRMMKPCFTREALQLHHDVAITELRKYLESLVHDDHERTLEEEVQLLCSIVLFISTEVSPFLDV